MRQPRAYRNIGWWIVLCILCNAGMLASQPSLHEAAEEYATPGRRYFVQYCSACHGLDGHGDGPAAPALRTPPADLTRIAQRRKGHFPAAEIAAYIDGRTFVRAHGSREMPVWGERFSDQVGGGSIGEEVVRGNLLLLVNYLQSIQQ